GNDFVKVSWFRLGCEVDKRALVFRPHHCRHVLNAVRASVEPDWKPCDVCRPDSQRGLQLTTGGQELKRLIRLAPPGVSDRAGRDELNFTDIRIRPLDPLVK